MRLSKLKDYQNQQELKQKEEYFKKAKKIKTN
jgi:hypothetical protein